MATAYTHRSNDHELALTPYAAANTKALEIMRDDDGRPIYTVSTETPEYRNPFVFEQTSWIGGHRQRDYINPFKYYEGESIDTTQDGRILLGGKIFSVGVSGASLGAEPKHFIWFAAITKWMCATTSKVFWYDGINFVEKTDITGETISNLAVVNDILYVSLGTSTKYYYSADGITYTQTDLADGYAEKIITAPNAAGTAMILWKFKTPNELTNTTDGRTAGDGGIAWSSAAYIGDTSYDITNIFLSQDRLLVAKEDNVYYYDSNGGTHPLMNDVGKSYSADNFKYETEWRGSSYFSLLEDIKELTGTTLDSVSPLEENKDIATKYGTCKGIIGDKRHLYVSMRTVLNQFPYTFPITFYTASDTTTVIYKGTTDGVNWSWCPWIKLASNLSSTLAICHHSDFDRRLWFGYGDYAGYVMLADNPTDDNSPACFPSAGWIRLSYVYGTDPYWDKLFQSIVTETKGCSATLTVTPKYRKDTDTSATALTSAITTNGVVKTTLTTALNCNRIQFELHLATDDEKATPEVLFFQARGIEKPETVRIHDVVYKATSEPSRTSETVRDFLRDGKTSTSLVKFADLRWKESTGDTTYHWVTFEPGYPKEVEIVHEKGRKPELGIQVRMREVSFTVS